MNGDYTSGLLFKAEGTADAVRAGTKTVTRRIARTPRPRWRIGALARVYERDPRAGGTPFAEVRIEGVRRERIRDMTDDDVPREGTSARSPVDFAQLFADLHGLTFEEAYDAEIWRVEFRLARLLPVAP